MKKRVQSIKEKEVREFHRKKRELIKKLQENGIPYLLVGQDDSELYAQPENYKCVLSLNEYEIDEYFMESAGKENVYISLHDYETFNLL